MRIAIVAACLALTSLCCQAQESMMAILFKEMPDSLLPYLTKNNRLDMIDFMEAGMKAEVTNRLEGKSLMTMLTADSLSLQLNDMLQVDMQLRRVDEPVDSSQWLVCVRRTYRLNEKQTACIVDVYTAAWRLLSSQSDGSSILRRDEEIFAQPYF